MIEIYWFIVIAVILLGLVMPQQGVNRKYYITIMCIIHSFICGFRYHNLTGDLIVYHTTYSSLANYGWLSEEVIQGGRNSGFYLFMKLVATLSNYNYQINCIYYSLFLFII